MCGPEATSRRDVGILRVSASGLIVPLKISGARALRLALCLDRSLVTAALVPYCAMPVETCCVSTFTAYPKMSSVGAELQCSAAWTESKHFLLRDILAKRGFNALILH